MKPTATRTSENDNAAEQTIACTFCNNTLIFGGASPAFMAGPDFTTPLAVVEGVAAMTGWSMAAKGWKCGQHKLESVA